MLNPSQDPVFIRKDTVIGLAEPLDLDDSSPISEACYRISGDEMSAQPEHLQPTEIPERLQKMYNESSHQLPPQGPGK